MSILGVNQRVCSLLNANKHILYIKRCLFLGVNQRVCSLLNANKHILYIL